MPEPIFETNDLIVNEYSVFVKSIYKNITYFEISHIELFKGHVIKKWKLSLILGLAMTIFFAILIVRVTPNIEIPTDVNIRAQMAIYISLYILLIFGIYLLYLSVSKKPVIKIITLDNQEYLYPLPNNKNQLLDIVSSLKTCDVTVNNMLNIN